MTRSVGPPPGQCGDYLDGVARSHPLRPIVIGPRRPVYQPRRRAAWWERLLCRVLGHDPLRCACAARLGFDLCSELGLGCTRFECLRCGQRIHDIPRAVVHR